jgi:hypothetical protein
MSTEDEASATESLQQATQCLDTVVSRLQLRKAADQSENAKAKRAALKVQGSGNKKKPKIPGKTNIVGVLQAIEKDGIEAFPGMNSAEGQEGMEEEDIGDVNTPSLVPQHLTDSPGEAH